ncbi:MAG: putative aminotransferase [Acidimicrobiales bacterium]|nr:putative aminotransferase [Acidimicrobiales bacterium]
MIRYSRQRIDEADIAAVVAVLQGDWLTTGPAVDAFEAALCELTGAAFAVAFANGTAALHGAAAAAGLGPGDVVATSPLSFVASANCARYVGATPTFVDIDPATLNLDVAAVPVGLDALVAVHYAGLPVDLARLAHRPRIVIEDAAHAIGALTPDGPVGNCAHSDLCCFSFHPVKPITTGEGGAVTTNDAELAARLRRFRNHGIVPTPEAGGWSYEVVDTGYNYRLTDLQAALGTSQLAKLEAFTIDRNRAAARYRELLADDPIVLPPLAGEGWRNAHHLFAVRVEDRRRIYEGLHAAGIGAQVHYVPIHHHPLMAPYGPFDLPQTDRAYEQLLSLPLYPGLTAADQDRVIDVLRSLW